MRRLCIFLLALAVGGCASVRGPAVAPQVKAAVELDDTPFFPQREYQCGPAALATSLAASGVNITADELVPEVYLPGRKGSLQAEIIASARRHHRVAAPIRGDANALVAELQAGRPVLVLLNLGVSFYPVWHYAVVVGYEPAAQRYILRSGTERRAMLGVRRFARAWAYGGNWGVVVSEVDAIPVTTSMQSWLASVAPFEALGDLDRAAQGYRAATKRWPDSALPWLALGNARARGGQAEEAIAAYSAAIAREDTVAARNNRADMLARLQCAQLAERDLHRAAELDVDALFRDVLFRTQASIPTVDACPIAITERIASP